MILVRCEYREGNFGSRKERVSLYVQETVCIQWLVLNAKQAKYTFQLQQQLHRETMRRRLLLLWKRMANVIDNVVEHFWKFIFVMICSTICIIQLNTEKMYSLMKWRLSHSLDYKISDAKSGCKKLFFRFVWILNSAFR